MRRSNPLLFGIPESDLTPYQRERRRVADALPRELQNNLQWLYSYPVIDGRIQNQAVDEFISGVLHLKESGAHKAFEDFQKRSYTINMLNVECDKSNFQDYLLKFLQPANAYSSDDKKKIVDFIASRGGQDLNYLIQKIIQANHFLPEGYIGVASNKQDILSADWSISESGKAVFVWQSDLLVINAKCKKHQNSECILVKDEDEGLRHFNSEEPLQIEEFNDFRESKPLSPMMRIYYEITLDIENNCVMPVVRNLTVINFTKVIQKPYNQLINPNDARQVLICNCVKYIDESLKKYDIQSSEYHALETLSRILGKSNYGKKMEDIVYAMEYIESINLRLLVKLKNKVFGCKQQDICLKSIFFRDDEFVKRLSSLTGTSRFVPLTRVDGSEEKLAKYLFKLGVGMSHILDCTKSENIRYTLGSIYLSLRKLYSMYESIYSINFSKQCDVVSGFFIDTWQNRMQNSQRNPSAPDLERKIEEQIHEFMRDSAYGKDDKSQAVKNWMKEKPMESMQSLIYYMFEHHLFSIHASNINDSFVIVPRISSICESRWFIDREGRASLSLIFEINALSVTSSDGQQNHIFVRQKGGNKHLMSGGEKGDPIARISATISLDVNDDLQVCPNVRDLQVVSFSPDFVLSQRALLTYATEVSEIKDSSDFQKKF